jgi:hypothetical protein
MQKCFQVDLRLKDGFTRAMAFDAMKQMQQESSLIDESITISYDYITLTAGFYDNFYDFDDLFLAVVCKDKELIKNHVKEFFPNIQDQDVRNAAINNICESLRRYNDGRVFFLTSEIEELKKISIGKRKVYSKSK